jgi:hypothetical protein
MERQSSRAEITPWSFDNEYHYGDFRGNAEEMLRRGYDLHLHYADFGIRKLMIRLPQGLPDPKTARLYLDEESLRFLPDKRGRGGILSIQPMHEPGDLEDLWEVDDLVDRLVPLRAELLAGDLRPLYLAHLAISRDDDHDRETTKEGPVPAGLEKISDAQHALAELYDLSDSLIAAAAQGSPPLASQNDAGNDYVSWLQSQPAATKDEWLAKWMADSHCDARRQMISEFHASRQSPLWRTASVNRTIAELESIADGLHSAAKLKASAKAARERAKRLEKMAADPTPTIRETEKLVSDRSTDAYGKIAAILADLREALAGSKNAGLAERQARKLKDKNPTLRVLVKELRGKGFLPK